MVRIEFMSEEPPTFWTTAEPREYGFYSNVNPSVPHPRWSQEREIPLGTNSLVPTRTFNGYGQPLRPSADDLHQLAGASKGGNLGRLEADAGEIPQDQIFARGKVLPRKWPPHSDLDLSGPSRNQ